MKNQVKVSKTHPYKDGQVNTIVCQGTLKLFPCADGEGIYAIRAIIFSQVEEIEKGDTILFDNQYIHEVAIAEKYKLYFKDGGTAYRDECKKVLAHERNFSPKQLQVIVDTKLKDGHSVLVKCHEPLYERDALEGKFTQQYIHFDGNNHIKLFPVKHQPTTSEEKLKQLASLLEKAGVRKYTCINRSGYSQVERDIVELLSPSKKESLNDRLFTLANDFAIAKKGDVAVLLHGIYNNL